MNLTPKNDKSHSLNKIHVFIAFDREGPKETETSLDLTELKKIFNRKNSRILSINEIIATQDLESWFFHDLEGIYSFLNVPSVKRNLSAYNNIEATNNRILSDLFHRNKKHYQKGKRASGFIESLDLDKIHKNCEELKNAIEFIQSLT
ncbi:MAG: DUF4276 family protein [Bacteroidia bacterium]